MTVNLVDAQRGEAFIVGCMYVDKDGNHVWQVPLHKRVSLQGVDVMLIPVDVKNVTYVHCQIMMSDGKHVKPELCLNYKRCLPDREFWDHVSNSDGFCLCCLSCYCPNYMLMQLFVCKYLKTSQTKKRQREELSIKVSCSDDIICWISRVTVILEFTDISRHNRTIV